MRLLSVRTLVGGGTPLQRCCQCILKPQQTGPKALWIANTWYNILLLSRAETTGPHQIIEFKDALILLCSLMGDHCRFSKLECLIANHCRFSKLKCLMADQCRFSELECLMDDHSRFSKLEFFMVDPCRFSKLEHLIKKRRDIFNYFEKLV